MLNEIRKIAIFIRRDFGILFTYRLASSATLLGMVFSFLYIVMFGSMFGTRLLPALAPYGGDFISYILVGSIGWGFLWMVMSTTSNSITYEMMMGTLESVLLTKTNILTMMIAYTIFGCLFSLIPFLMLISIGFVFFGVVIGNATIYTFLIVLLSVLMMMGLGIICGGITMCIKNIGPVISLIQSIATFFCGVYFPISILPEVLQPVAQFIPFYYSIEGLRRSLIATTPPAEIMNYVLVLLGLTFLFVFSGVLISNRLLAKAKKDGSLAFY